MLAEDLDRPAEAERRLEALDNARLLEDLQAAGLLGDGAAHVISLQAVREALGRRWGERKLLVWSAAESMIRKRIGERDLTARLSEDAFLLLTPELGPAAARVLAARVCREILAHFLGQPRAGDIVVLVAGRFEDGVLECRQVPGAEIERALSEDPAPWAGKGMLLAASEPEEHGALTTFHGQRLRFSVRVDPIIDLERWAVAGHRIEPKITLEATREPLSPAERGHLLPRDLLESDLATLRRGLSRLRAGESSSARPSLILAVSFQTLSNTRTRLGLLAQAVEQRSEMLKSVIWEISDLDGGVPAGPLKQVVGLLKPFCRSVFTRTDVGAHRILAGLKPDVAGFVLPVPRTAETEADQLAWLDKAGHVLRKRDGTLIAASLASGSLLSPAKAAGFTHATLRV